ncbi:MAG: carbohydrate ABC transporter permease [Ruminococcus sp.]
MKNSLPYKIITQAICVVLLVILVFPLYLMLEKSLAVSGFGNYAKVFEYFNLIPNVITSIIVVGGTLVVVSIVVSMASYAFSKLEFPHKQAVYYLLLTGMMIPTSALIFPLYQIVRGLHLNNTGWSLVFPYATASACFNLMVLTNYYNALPDELIDAAKIDGANKWTTFIQIMLPIAKPGLVFVLIQTFYLHGMSFRWRSFLLMIPRSSLFLLYRCDLRRQLQVPDLLLIIYLQLVSSVFCQSQYSIFLHPDS